MHALNTDISFSQLVRRLSRAKERRDEILEPLPRALARLPSDCVQGVQDGDDQTDLKDGDGRVMDRCSGAKSVDRV